MGGRKVFRDYIYLDMNKIRRYGEKCGVDESRIKEKKNSVTEEMYFEEFEYKLENEHEDRDFVIISEQDTKENIEKVKKQMIIRFEKELLIPSEFGQVEFLKKVLSNNNAKDSLINTISHDDSEIPREFLNSLIKDRGCVPAFFELEGYNIYTNLQGEYFRSMEYADFEENVGEPVTVVGKVEGICKIDKDIAIYDIYKDLLGLNREMRRSFTSKANNSDIPEQITIHGKGIKLSILAIYK